MLLRNQRHRPPGKGSMFIISDTAGAEEDTITVEKSDGTKVTVSRRADGQIAVTSSKNPDSTMVISPDLFCSSIGV
jgi:hypothetical protein